MRRRRPSPPPARRRPAPQRRSTRSLEASGHRFPSTRYQGSKLKLLGWLWESIQHLRFDTCLDLFSGTASVAYLLKAQGKQVTTNDYLKFNQVIARALVCNNTTRLDSRQATELFRRQDRPYATFIAEQFREIFYPDHENAWLDVVAQNIAAMGPGAERDLALFALYQSCLAKRPYNLFHRANLYMRTAQVERGFGNKATWERPFEEHFGAALHEANEAIFDNGRVHTALCMDFLDVPGKFDLVYMDPPYLNARGTGVDYLEFYHFLEGLTEYHEWPLRLTDEYKPKPYRRRANAWNRRADILGAFDKAVERYRDSVMVISYRSDGTPSVEDLVRLLQRHGRKDARQSQRDYQYVLSGKSGREFLLVSEA